ncbi:hypothetical protein ACHAQH_004009 [Verticillium albo-atrum]
MADVQVLPSHMRTVPGSVNVPVAKFPSVTPATDLEPEQAAAGVVAQFNKALEQSDFAAIAGLFDHEGFWRDHLALSWEFHTNQGPSKIQKFLEDSAGSKDGCRLKRIDLDQRSDVRKPQKTFLDFSGTVPCVAFFFTLQTAVGSGEGVARVIDVGGSWKIFTLYTTLQEIKGHEEAVGHRRVRGVEHGGKPGRKNWAERRQAEAELEDAEPAVIILGAGQAGLTISARLKALGVNSLMLDQNDRVGDNWRKRYHQLVLHDPVWFDNLPYIKFPPQWPVFTPKDKLADFFESYAKLLELNVWMKTSVTAAKYHDDKRVWDVTVTRTLADGTTQTRTLHPRHVIQATGQSGKKNFPSVPGLSSFAGHLLCHSSEFPGARASVAPGTRAIVVGSCNSGHDIAQDFVERGYDVTMVQRSTTCVVSSDAIVDIAFGGLYSESAPPNEESDMLLHSLPAPVLKANEILATAKQNDVDRELLDGLARAGFKVDMGPDEAGILLKYFQRGGGYYIDVGAARLVVEGKIKIKQGQEIVEVLPGGLRFADGSELEADEIVFATGYQNMRTETRIVFGDEVADRVGDIWGFNEEGEQRIIWQKSGHPGFWFHGGNLALCRFYSKLLALQIKGLEEGVYQYGDK